jgi:hypothetical protein
MPSPAIRARRRAVRVAVVVAGALAAASVLLAVVAAPGVAADRIRPLSELVDAGLGALRALGTARLVVGGLIVAVVYAGIAAAVSRARRADA